MAFILGIFFGIALTIIVFYILISQDEEKFKNTP